MKRLMCILCLLCCLAPAVLAEGATGGSETNFADCTLDELLALREEIDRVIQERVQPAYEDDMIGEGEYKVGEDIKPGKYEFVCTAPLRGEVSSVLTGTISLYGDDKETLEASYDYLAADSRVTLNMEEGQVLQIVWCTGRLVLLDQNWMSEGETTGTDVGAN